MAEIKVFQLFRRGSRLKKPSLRLSILSLIIGLFSFQPVSAEFGSIVDIGFAGDFYFTNENANNGQGYVNLLMQNKWSDSILWIDVGAGGLIGDTATSYVKAPQIYYRMGKRNEMRLTVGRALHDWSFADDNWDMGLTQPLFKWNQARPEEQGLFGVFFTYPILKNKFEFTAFASPIFVPSQGPSYELTNGKITSSNPWFNEPVQVLDLSGNKVDLSFDVDVPKAQDVLLQESYGLQFATPQNKRDFLLNVFALDKPRNDLVLPFQGQLNLTTLDGDISIQPVVPRHQVIGTDIGWNFRRFKTTFSYLYESKVEYDAPEGTFFPIIPEQHIYSVDQLIRISRNQRISFAYIKVDRNENQIGGDTTGAQVTAFAARNRFEEAARVKWQSLLLKRKGVYRINTSLAYTQSLFRDNAWISTDIRWSINKGLEAYSQCDFFGGSENQIEALDFISTYQNNDRCLIGGHYAF